MEHVMVDTETLGLQHNAVFLSVAAIQFDIKTGELGKQFYKNVKLQSSLDIGLKVEEQTLLWWLEQPRETFNKMFEYPLDISIVLDEFNYFIQQTQLKYLWGCSAEFDLAKIRYAMQLTSRLPAWDAKNERCYRSVRSFFPKITEDFIFTNDMPHHPLFDARFQIEYLTKLNQKYNA